MSQDSKKSKSKFIEAIRVIITISIGAIFCTVMPVINTFLVMFFILFVVIELILSFIHTLHKNGNKNKDEIQNFFIDINKYIIILAIIIFFYGILVLIAGDDFAISFIMVLLSISIIILFICILIKLIILIESYNWKEFFKKCCKWILKYISIVLAILLAKILMEHNLLWILWIFILLFIISVIIITILNRKYFEWILKNKYAIIGYMSLIILASLYDIPTLLANAIDAFLTILLNTLINLLTFKQEIVFYAKKNIEIFVLYIYATLLTTIFTNFKDEVVEIFKWGGIESLQVSFQNYLFILSIVISIAIAIVLDYSGFYNYILGNTDNTSINILENILNFFNSTAAYADKDSGNFLTVGSILATISALLVSISWVVIQTSSEKYNHIIMWQWVRDARFMGFVVFSFSTVFLLIMISLTHIQLHVIDYGVIYYIILLNFLMYALYIRAFINVINPKNAVDFILRGRDRENKTERIQDNDLTDAESRLLAVYEIIKKSIDVGDVYAVVKCLNKIHENFDEYWIFDKDKNENCKEDIKKFSDILTILKKEYLKNCRKMLPYFERQKNNEFYKLTKKGKNAFNELINKCDNKLKELES